MGSSQRNGMQLGMLLSSACERLMRAVFARLAGAGYAHLTPSQAMALLLVDDGLGTVTQIAEALGMTSQAMSKICSALEADGLLSRGADESDARQKRLLLTKSGGEAVREMRAAAANEELAWEKLVGPETISTVRHALVAFSQTPDDTVVAAPVHIRFS